MSTVHPDWTCDGCGTNRTSKTCNGPRGPRTLCSGCARRRYRINCSECFIIFKRPTAAETAAGADSTRCLSCHEDRLAGRPSRSRLRRASNPLLRRRYPLLVDATTPNTPAQNAPSTTTPPPATSKSVSNTPVASAIATPVVGPTSSPAPTPASAPAALHPSMERSYGTTVPAPSFASPTFFRSRQQTAPPVSASNASAPSHAGLSPAPAQPVISSQTPIRTAPASTPPGIVSPMPPRNIAPAVQTLASSARPSLAAHPSASPTAPPPTPGKAGAAKTRPGPSLAEGPRRKRQRANITPAKSVDPSVSGQLAAVNTVTPLRKRALFGTNMPIAKPSALHTQRLNRDGDVVSQDVRTVKRLPQRNTPTVQNATVMATQAASSALEYTPRANVMRRAAKKEQTVQAVRDADKHDGTDGGDNDEDDDDDDDEDGDDDDDDDYDDDDDADQLLVREVAHFAEANTSGDTPKALKKSAAKQKMRRTPAQAAKSSRNAQSRRASASSAFDKGRQLPVATHSQPRPIPTPTAIPASLAATPATPVLQTTMQTRNSVQSPMQTTTQMGKEVVTVQVPCDGNGAIEADVSDAAGIPEVVASVVPSVSTAVAKALAEAMPVLTEALANVTTSLSPSMAESLSQTVAGAVRPAVTKAIASALAPDLSTTLQPVLTSAVNAAIGGMHITVPAPEAASGGKKDADISDDGNAAGPGMLARVTRLEDQVARLASDAENRMRSLADSLKGLSEQQNAVRNAVCHIESLL